MVGRRDLIVAVRRWERYELQPVAHYWVTDGFPPRPASRVPRGTARGGLRERRDPGWPVHPPGRSRGRRGG